MSKVLKNLNIRKFATRAGYNSATVGDEDLCVILDGSKPTLQVKVVPEASAAEEGNIYQYIGDTEYQTGSFIRCEGNGTNYWWSRIDVQPQTEPVTTRWIGAFTLGSGISVNTIRIRPYLRRVQDDQQYDGDAYVNLFIPTTPRSEFVVKIMRGGAFSVKQQILKATGVFETARVYKIESSASSQYLVIQKEDATDFVDKSVSDTTIRIIYDYYGSLANSTFNADVTKLATAVQELRVEVEDYNPAQVDVMPSIAPAEVGRIIQFVGENGTYSNGSFYRCVGNIIQTIPQLRCVVTNGSDVTVDCMDADGAVDLVREVYGTNTSTAKNYLGDPSLVWSYNYTGSQPEVYYDGNQIPLEKALKVFAFSRSIGVGETVEWNSPLGYINSYETVENGKWIKFDVGEVGQYNLLPSDIDYSGKIVQYVGNNDGTHEKGHFYQCIMSGNPENVSASVIVGSLTDLDVDADVFKQKYKPTGDETVSFVYQDIAETLTATSDNQNITVDSVDAGVFASQMRSHGVVFGDSLSGRFEYHSNNIWIVTAGGSSFSIGFEVLGDFGITISGTPAVGDGIDYTYSAAINGWFLGNDEVVISRYGISFSGTPVNNDEIQVVYTESTLTTVWEPISVQNISAESIAPVTGLTDGNYRLRLTITNGEPTLSWVAE